MTANPEELMQFLEYLWGPDSPDGKPTFVYLPVKSEDGKWRKVTFSWPRSAEGVIEHILAQNAMGSDVYFSPALYRAAKPIKENVKGSWCLWADLDGNAPDDWSKVPGLPEPTLVVQSSIAGHEHAYWRLDSFLTDLSTLEERNRAIALLLGADYSGWDGNQVLRPIGTTNYKRMEPVVPLRWDL
jgi:hypothetical protein